MMSRLLLCAAPRDTIFWRCLSSCAPGRACTITSMSSSGACARTKLPRLLRLSSGAGDSRSGDSFLRCPKEEIVVVNRTNRSRTKHVLFFVDIVAYLTGKVQCSLDAKSPDY